MGDSSGRWTELMSSLFTTTGNKEAILEYLHNNAEKQAEYHEREAKYWRGMAETTGALKGKCVEGTAASGSEAQSEGASDAKLSELITGLNKVLSIVETNKSLIAETKADIEESAKMTQEQMKTMSEATAAAAASNAAAAQASAAASVIVSANIPATSPATVASPPPRAEEKEPPAPVKKEEPPAPKPEPLKENPPKPASPPKPVSAPKKEPKTPKKEPEKKVAPPPAKEPEKEKPKKKMSAFERARMKAKQAEEEAAKAAAEKPKPRYGGSRKKFGGKKLTNTKMFEGIVPGGGAPGMSSAGATAKNIRKASNPEPPKPKAADPPPPAPASDEKTAVALYDLNEAANDEALTFKTGDRATIVSMDGEWWLVNLNGKQGYVPHNFFKLEETAAKAEPPPPAAVAPPPAEEAAPPPPAADGGPPGCLKAIALYSYSPAPGGDHAVSMEKDDIVYLDPSVVGTDDPNEWRYVHKGDDKGYVPRDYIQVL